MLRPDPRHCLPTLVADRGHSLAALSRYVGKNDAYLQQFITRGSPRHLPEDIRLKLAQCLQIDERVLGARDPWTPQQ